MSILAGIVLGLIEGFSDTRGSQRPRPSQTAPDYWQREQNLSTGYLPRN